MRPLSRRTRAATLAQALAPAAAQAAAPTPAARWADRLCLSTVQGCGQQAAPDGSAALPRGSSWPHSACGRLPHPTPPLRPPRSRAAAPTCYPCAPTTSASTSAVRCGWVSGAARRCRARRAAPVAPRVAGFKGRARAAPRPPPLLPPPCLPPLMRPLPHHSLNPRGQSRTSGHWPSPTGRGARCASASSARSWSRWSGEGGGGGPGAPG